MRGDFLLTLRRAHGPGRISLEQIFTPQIAEEGPYRRKLSRCRGPRIAARVQLAEKGAHHQNVQVQRLAYAALLGKHQKLREVAVVGPSRVSGSVAVEPQIEDELLQLF